MIDLQWLNNHPTEVFECIAKLEAENGDLKAQVEQLSILCLAYEDKLPFPPITKEMFKPVFKARSLLAEIKAQVIAEFVDEVIRHFEGCNYNLTRQTLKCYLHEQLRQRVEEQKNEH